MEIAVSARNRRKRNVIGPKRTKAISQANNSPTGIFILKTSVTTANKPPESVLNKGKM